MKAETEGKILQERKNHDLIVEKKKLEQVEYRETVLKSIELAGTTLGEGFKAFISDREKLTNTAAVLTVAAFGIYTARTSTGYRGLYTLYTL